VATYSKLKLSGSTDGRPINVTATSTPGTTIHTSHATSLDEIWLWAANTDTTDRKLTIEFGLTTTADTWEFTVPAEDGLYQVCPGLILTNSLLVRAFGATTSINIVGYVNRIT
jgi:hypothetical protein